MKEINVRYIVLYTPVTQQMKKQRLKRVIQCNRTHADDWRCVNHAAAVELAVQNRQFVFENFKQPNEQSVHQVSSISESKRR
jgi:hypothetical protein